MSSFKFYIKDYASDPITRLYDLKETIGSGTFAEVKKGIDRRSGDAWAMKMIAKAKLDKEDEDALAVEVEILEKVKHPNIVQLRQVIDTRRHFYMVMELLTGGELFDRIVDKVKYTEHEAVGVVRQVADGLKYCHALGIVHRDLKPENLIYSSKDEDAPIKIADFGLGKIVDDDRIAMATACGTPGYVAAEILHGQKYTDKVDCWSLGVITYILLCGFPPFYDENMHNLFKLIKSGSYAYPSPYWDGVSEEAKDFINRLLVTDPRGRMSAAECLEHPWLKSGPSGAAAGAAASGGTSLSGAQELIKKMQVRKRFRSKVQSVLALNRFKRLSGLAGLSLADRLEKAAETEEGPGLGGDDSPSSAAAPAPSAAGGGGEGRSAGGSTPPGAASTGGS